MVRIKLKETKQFKLELSNRIFDREPQKWEHFAFQTIHILLGLSLSILKIEIITHPKFMGRNEGRDYRFLYSRLFFHYSTCHKTRIKDGYHRESWSWSSFKFWYQLILKCERERVGLLSLDLPPAVPDSFWVIVVKLGGDPPPPKSQNLLH